MIPGHFYPIHLLLFLKKNKYQKEGIFLQQFGSYPYSNFIEPTPAFGTGGLPQQILTDEKPAITFDPGIYGTTGIGANTTTRQSGL